MEFASLRDLIRMWYSTVVSTTRGEAVQDGTDILIPSSDCILWHLINILFSAFNITVLTTARLTQIHEEFNCASCHLVDQLFFFFFFLLVKMVSRCYQKMVISWLMLRKLQDLFLLLTKRWPLESDWFLRKTQILQLLFCYNFDMRIFPLISIWEAFLQRLRWHL